MRRRVSAARVKRNRSYTLEEAAEQVGVTVQTIRAWVKRGLPVLSARRPYLVLGVDLIDFVKNRSAPRTRRLRIGEFHCLSCKAPRKPAFGIADYVPITPLRGRLEAFCETCGIGCHRFVSAAQIPVWRTKVEIGGN